MKGKEITGLAQGIDIYPTIMKLIGGTGPEYLEGEDLFDIKKDYVVSEEGGSQKTIEDKKWKLYFKDYKNVTPDNTELYDLENDLYEQKDVSKENPKIVEEKIIQLNEFLNKNKNILKQKYNFPDWIDEVKREKLVKEGYF
jgi:arylsulfatase A-like enzyme